MYDKEYTYDIDKYTIGVDENGEDGIGMTIAIIKNGEINLLGNCYGENARCIDLLIKENQALKKQSHEASLTIQEMTERDIECPSNCEKLRRLKKQYENAVADYETTMFEKEQLNSLVNSCQKEIRQLKKQVEENKDNYNCLLKQKEQFEYIMSKQVDYQGQQKEFIKYLEDLIKQNETVVEVSKYGLPKICSKLLIDFYKEILQEFKSIIGVSDENTKN